MTKSAAGRSYAHVTLCIGLLEFIVAVRQYRAGRIGNDGGEADAVTSALS